MNEPTLYYYFIEGYDTIFVMRQYICDAPNSQYTELSIRQLAFYKLHPTARAREVIQGYMDEDAPVVEIPLEEYKSQKIKELNTLSLSTAGSLSPAYQRENAAISLELLNLQTQGIQSTQEPLYPRERCIEILENANRVAILCRNERYRIATLINDANDATAVDVAFLSNNYETIQ